MSEHELPAQSEEDIRRAFNIPPVRSQFIDHLEAELLNRWGQKRLPGFHVFRHRAVWTMIPLIVLVTAVVGMLIWGPQRVYAAVQHLLGYIPGFGLVDTHAPVRVLAQPVSLTQAGVTVAVEQAVLTATETRIKYGVSGVPLSAYPQGEAVLGCTDTPYVILPDGTAQALEAPIPPDVNEVTFVLPCIPNTLPGSVPSNWRLTLRFVPAPPEFTILPVMDATTPTLPVGHTPTTSSASTPQSHASAQASLMVEKVIETADGYILLGAVRSDLPEGQWLEITGVPVITDAAGNKVPYSYPSDVQPLNDPASDLGTAIPWVLQIRGNNIEFPITLEFPCRLITEVALPSPLTIPLDVGAAPQIGQTWTLNREITVDRFNVRLVSVTADSHEGYTFLFETTDSNLYDLNVEIEGALAVGGGGGGETGRLMKSLSFTQRPVGILNIRISHLWVIAATQRLSTTWSPLTAHQLSTQVPNPEACFNAETMATLPYVPSSWQGTVIVSRLNPQAQIVQASLDGTQQHVIAPGSTRAALSPKGDSLAYVTEEGIVIQNLGNHEIRVIPGQFGGSLSWSPDAQRIAGVNAAGQYGIFVLDLTDGQIRRLSNLGYESIAGWSPDGTRLYYAIPGPAEDFLLKAIEVQSGTSTDVFALENASRKAPMAVLSPDGQWVAYRGRDNNSLYLKPLKGGPARLILDQPGLAINGLVWETMGRFLGVSLITTETPEGRLYLIAPDSCTAYRIPGVSGALNGIRIP
ncbi:hypothetical protein [uncultured Thermanaerothrix sp.]|uniref:TolB family protein n=1 Tax=uncultured Thermanaerothrix sp. TaxID=1195149 RepID=UPI0026186B60|nr:hypothetical protein [uncultured Thermanaerothrix sp.]